MTGTTWLAQRALLAIVLMVSFYVLAAAVVLGAAMWTSGEEFAGVRNSFRRSVDSWLRLRSGFRALLPEDARRTSVESMHRLTRKRHPKL